MTVINVNLEDVVETYAMPGDSEVTLRITSVKEGVDKNGNNYFMPRFEVSGEVAAKDFSKFLGLPHDGMEPKRLNNSKFGLLQFLSCFGMDPSQPFDVEDLIGLEGDAILGLEETAEYGEQNYVKRFVVPQ